MFGAWVWESEWVGACGSDMRAGTGGLVVGELFCVGCGWGCISMYEREERIEEEADNTHTHAHTHTNTHTHTHTQETQFRSRCLHEDRICREKARSQRA